jgi:hypothetical protein
MSLPSSLEEKWVIPCVFDSTMQSDSKSSTPHLTFPYVAVERKFLSVSDLHNLAILHFARLRHLAIVPRFSGWPNITLMQST